MVKDMGYSGMRDQMPWHARRVAESQNCSRGMRPHIPNTWWVALFIRQIPLVRDGSDGL